MNITMDKITLMNLTVDDVKPGLFIYIEGYTASDNRYHKKSPQIVKIYKIVSKNPKKYQIDTINLNGETSYCIRAKDIKGIVSPEENPEYYL